MADLTGQNLGNYRLVRLLGSGGFAEVYLGEHLRLSTQAAIKILYTHVKGAEANDFLSEARTIARLDHPSIVRILDCDVQDGTPFFVMAYAPNGNLRTRHAKGSRLPLPLVNNYLQQVAEALQYAHDGKIIHRDIKPENMLVGARNEILLSDFGLAVIEQSSRLQSSQAIMGTAFYMAPEQLQGKPRVASDQYSLGVVVYEWLSGERPFHGTFMELYSQHLSVQPPPLRAKLLNLPPSIERVVMTALAKEPSQRFISIKAFAIAFEQAINQALSTSPLPELSPLTQPAVAHPPSTPLALVIAHSPNTLSPVASPSDPNRTLPRGARPTPSGASRQTNSNYPSQPFPSPHPSQSSQPLPPMVTRPHQASDGPSQNQPQIPFYRVEDMVINDDRKRGIPRRGLLLGAGALTLLAASGAAWFLFAPHAKPAVLQGRLLCTYRGHSSSVLTVAWAPDGTRIASADNTVQVWDAAKGRTIYIYKGQSGSVNAVAWAPDGTRIASAGDDTTVQIWNAVDGGTPYIYKSHSASVATVAWSPNGTRIASGGSDNTVRVWNAANGSEPYVYKGHTYHVNTVAWSPNGTRIASGGGDNTAQVWNATNGKERLTYKGHSSPVQSLAWSPDGRHIATASDDTSVQIWNASDGTALSIYRGHSASVTAVAWSPDGKRIASGGFDRTVHIWDVGNGGSAYIYTGHSEVVNAVAWAPDGKRIASASNDHTAQIWYAEAT